MSSITRSAVEAMDARDPLSSCRARFALPSNVVYLDGNSLGALPVTTSARLGQVVEAWGRDLIRSWNGHDWIGWPKRVGDRIAPLIGARAGEVIVADSTSVNVFKLLSAALDLQRGRSVILSETDNFPTDLYVAQGLIDALDKRVELRTVDAPALSGALGRDVAVMMLTHVNYRTGAMHDMAALTAAAHDAGALALWDLSHSTGAMPLALDEVGIRPALSGWMGHARPFDFDTTYEPAPGIERLLVGTPPVLSLAALDAGLETFEGVDLEQVHAKSVALGMLFRRLVEQECDGLGLQLVSPLDPERCGSQVATRIPTVTRSCRG